MTSKSFLIFVIFSVCFSASNANDPRYNDGQTTMDARLSILERNLKQYMNANDRLLEDNQNLKKRTEHNEMQISLLQKKAEENAQANGRLFEENKVLKKHINDIKKRNSVLSLKVRNLESAMTLKNCSQCVCSCCENHQGRGTAQNEMMKENKIEIPNANKELGKRIVPPTSEPPAEKIAFYSYLSGDAPANLPQYHTMIFNTVKVNKGQGYHKDDGIFIVPRSGVYVFSWTVASLNNGFASFEIVLNGQVVGSAFGDGDGQSWDFGSGLVVIEANAGDHVYVRTSANNVGVIGSSVYGRTSFAGWSLN